MSSTIVVTYTLRPEPMDEHLALIDAVFAELNETHRSDVSYEVLRLDDGVSFIHVSTATNVDGPNPVSELESFKAFSAGLPDRVASRPTPANADVIASYRPSAP